MSRPTRRHLMSTPFSELRETELIGLTEDGRKVLWSTGRVRPVSAFETTDGGRWIESGHYVIDWQGHAITVHCGNYVDGRVSVQFMCGALGSIGMKRDVVEAILLGVVVPDPKVAARITASLKRLTRELQAAQDVPHRQRGRIR